MEARYGLVHFGLEFSPKGGARRDKGLAQLAGVRARAVTKAEKKKEDTVTWPTACLNLLYATIS
jgi:hypothetical protein